jgi:AcrR family transcriptional regulator
MILNTIHAMARDSREREEQILRAAERLLKHYGFSKTTVSDIAREAEVGVGTVYLHFASKDDIVAALASRRHDHLLGEMRRIAEGEGGYADRLQALLRVRLEQLVRYLEDGQHGRDLVSCGCPAVTRIHANYRRAEQELLAEFLSRASRDGEFDVSECPAVSRLILLLCDQLTEDPGIREDARGLGRLVRLAHRILLRGLAVR